MKTLGAPWAGLTALSWALDKSELRMVKLITHRFFLTVFILALL
jgi:hypothetical protein